MATAGALLVAGSTAPDGSTAGVYIQNLGGGGSVFGSSFTTTISNDMTADLQPANLRSNIIGGLNASRSNQTLTANLTEKRSSNVC